LSARRWSIDIIVTGPLAAALFASTSGTDSDFVVKLIDVYPDNGSENAWEAEAGPKPGQYSQSLNDTNLPIAMEVRRGRFCKVLRRRMRSHAISRRMERSVARPMSERLCMLDMWIVNH